MGVRSADREMRGGVLCIPVCTPALDHCLRSAKYQIKEFQPVAAAEPGGGRQGSGASVLRCDLSGRLFVPPSFFVSSRPLLCVSSGDPLCTGGGVGEWEWEGEGLRVGHQKKKERRSY